MSNDRQREMTEKQKADQLEQEKKRQNQESNR